MCFARNYAIPPRGCRLAQMVKEIQPLSMAFPTNEREKRVWVEGRGTCLCLDTHSGADPPSSSSGRWKQDGGKRGKNKIRKPILDDWCMHSQLTTPCLPKDTYSLKFAMCILHLVISHLRPREDTGVPGWHLTSLPYGGIWACFHTLINNQNGFLEPNVFFVQPEQ